MKKKVCIISVLLIAMLAVSALCAQPGTDGDPLITKSYIDSVVYPHIKASSQFQIVNVPAGKSVICEAGTEVILRMGTCTVIASQKGGMSDVTMGFDLDNATSVQGNHLLITPVGDGRGVWTATDCILMVKGAYSIN